MAGSSSSSHPHAIHVQVQSGRRRFMRRKLFALPTLAAIAATVALWAQSTSHAGAPASPGYEPHLDPQDFSLVIDNPYFPLPVGRV
jgi:hypothetical protein